MKTINEIREAEKDMERDPLYALVLALAVLVGAITGFACRGLIECCGWM